MGHRLRQNYEAPFVSKLLKIRVFIFTARDILVQPDIYKYSQIYISTTK